MSANHDIAEKLDEARALIEKGWCQDILRDGNCYCAVGAIRKAVNGNLSGSNASMSVRRYVERAIGTNSIAGWNDDPRRTQAEVIEAFRKAAELARAGAVA